MQVQYSNETQFVSRSDLARHLTVHPDSLPAILAEHNLSAICRRYPWSRIWRVIHGIDERSLSNHLEVLQRNHDSPILGSISDLAAALQLPLMRFDMMARAMGVKPGTLSRAIREGRVVLPFPTLQLGPRIRRYRPLEVVLWRDEELLLSLPSVTSAPKKTGATVLSSMPLPNDRGRDAQKAIFGGFAGKEGAPGRSDGIQRNSC